MPVEKRGQFIAVEHGPTGSTRDEPEVFSGRRQPSCDGTSRMMREYHVRICERLGVKFPGPTRQKRRIGGRRGYGHPIAASVCCTSKNALGTKIRAQVAGQPELVH